MPDQLYRRCPDCREPESGSSCPTCGGIRFIPARPVGTGRRWRIRIGTLMLLVVIAALLSYIVAGWWHAAWEARSRAEVVARLLAEVRQSEATAAKANAQAQAPMPAPARPIR